jgi:HEAT repeat protein
MRQELSVTDAGTLARQLCLALLCPLAWPIVARPADAPRADTDRIHILVAALDATDERSRLRAEAELLAAGPAAVAPLIDVFSAPRLNEKALQRRAAALLPRFGPAALAELSDAGGRDYSGPPQAQFMWEAALRAALDMGPPATPALVALLQGPPVKVRRVFAESALARLGSSAAPALAPLLIHPDGEIRQQAARALAQRPTPEAREALLSGLRSTDPDVRGFCAGGLVRLGDWQDAETFLGLLRDPSEYVRTVAAAGLARTYRPDHRLPLGRLACCDDSSLVRNAAARALVDAPDPLAKRLGARYEPVRRSPVATPALVLRYLLGFLLTAAVLGMIGFATVSRGTEWVGSARAAVGTFAAGVVGLVWGGSMPHVVRAVELWFVCGLLPFVGILGVVAVRARAHQRAARTRMWIGVTAACYAGFGLGWVWLWGFLGV